MHATRTTDHPAHPSRPGRAPWRKLLALWVMLVIGVGEPAACIAHCLWWMGGEQAAGAHQHHGAHRHPPAAEAAPGAASQANPLPAAVAFLERRERAAQCHELEPGRPALPDTPVAVHDCVAPPPAAAPPVAWVLLARPPRPPPPPSQPAEPPFHPPISAAS